MRKKQKIVDVYEQIPRGKDYKPAITIQDISSLGRSNRVFGVRTGRQHDFLSDLERNYFHILSFSDQVVDVREQFPLQLDITMVIADELGIKHPINPRSKEPVTMTSDFNITLNIGGQAKDIVRTIKIKDDLIDRRIIEKFEIERVYWKRLGIDWGIVTSADIDKAFALNVADIMHYYNLEDVDSFKNIIEDEISDIIIAFMQRLIDSDKTIREISSLFERDVHLLKGTGISLFKHLLARKFIKIDLMKPLNMDKNIKVDLLQKAIDMGEGVS